MRGANLREVDLSVFAGLWIGSYVHLPDCSVRFRANGSEPVRFCDGHRSRANEVFAALGTFQVYTCSRAAGGAETRSRFPQARTLNLQCH
jgi:hypothetical protein